MLTGAGLNKAIDDVSKRFGVSYSSAARLIRTEHAKVASDAQKALYKDPGVSEVELVCTLDSVTCPKCGALEGTVIKETEMRAGVTAPPFHPRCRCTTAPYFEDMVEVGERAAREGLDPTEYVPSDMDYDEFSKLYLKTHNGKSIMQVKREIHLFGVLRLKLPKLPIDQYSYDSVHINEKHGNIPRKEAEGFISDAYFILNRHDGKWINYFSANGAAYVDPANENIRTAFRASQYDEKITTIKEAIDNVLGKRH